MDIWSWICELRSSSDWGTSTESAEDSAHVFELASSGTSHGDSTRSIQLRALRTTGSNTDLLVNFSVCLHGFHNLGAKKTLWVSDTCSVSSEDKSFLPLVLQLLQEIISHSPTANDTTCPRSHLHKLKPDPVSWIMDTHSPESFSSFFNLLFVTRLFWVCACDAPSEVGSLFFLSLLAPNLETLYNRNALVLRTFLITMGVDMELCFMRTVGYMLAKWCILRELGVGLQTLTPLATENLGFSYATEAHGLWVLKGYTPVSGTKLTRSNVEKNQFPVVEARDSLLKYALAHHQLEAVIQLEYTVGFYSGHIQVDARVDNLRIHVVKLGFNNQNDDVDYGEEKHFPSRIRVWVGPEVGANYVGGLSLGRSTDTGETETETQKVVKGSFGKSKTPKVKTVATSSTKTRKRNWKWDQDADGNAAVFEAVLCDSATGQEVATWKPSIGSGREESGLRKRYSGANRAFTKKGGVVMAGDEYGEGVGWRLSKEMEGSVLKWRIGGQVWLSYCANEVQSSYFETRCVEWCDEVDLPLIPPKYSF